MASGPSSDPQLLARLHDLELRSRAIADSLLPGRHRHPRPGWSVEFSQHREYSPGDDLRYVDWKATARSDRLLLRRYQDETALVAWLVVDASPSLAYQGKEATGSKFDIVSTLAAALAWVVIRQRDAVGLCIVHADGIETLAPSDEPSHWHLIAQRLAEANRFTQQATPREQTWNQGLQKVAAQVGRGSVVFALSDWLDDPVPLRAWLTLLTDQRKVDLRVLQCLDPDEIDLERVDANVFVWLEGEQRVSIESERLIAAYRQEVERGLEELRQLFNAFAVPYIGLRSNDDLTQAARLLVLAQSGSNLLQ